ncbi:hypothetical protein GGX14DRAFT_132181 [Mycena pura]|uniref:Uncharacterized protein n=1 Tax=Mycena pura TaxID=153505 RepID=A0AAD7E3F8_9AGAR|nr:hypothetical protein GGX14DRAFT_132181 [Mycena pura]
MASAASSADRLRIAIALTALKFKPADESCASYVLQLRSIFPPSEPVAPTSDGSWKTHALALEKDLASLKEKYDAKRINELAVPPPSAVDPPPNASQSTNRKPKKKTADVRLDLPARTSLEGVLNGLASQPNYILEPGSDMLFSSFSAFQQVVSALQYSSEAAVTTAERSLLLSTTKRALCALANILHPILCSTEITVASQTATLQTLTNLVHHLASSALPLLLRKKNTVSPLLNKLLDALLTSVFYPVLESLSALSNRYMNFLFPLKKSDTLPADVRPDVLHLFQCAFSPLVSIPSAFQANLRSTLALAALREFENIFPPRRPAAATALPQTHLARVSALARKDAIWYLCAVLHVLFAPAEDGSTSGSAPAGTEVFARRIVDAFSRIVARCRRCQEGASVPGAADESGPNEAPRNVLDLEVIDEVGYGMILGVMERYWRWNGEVQ